MLRFATGSLFGWPRLVWGLCPDSYREGGGGGCFLGNCGLVEGFGRVGGNGGGGEIFFARGLADFFRVAYFRLEQLNA